RLQGAGRVGHSVQPYRRILSFLRSLRVPAPVAHPFSWIEVDEAAQDPPRAVFGQDLIRHIPFSHARLDCGLRRVPCTWLELALRELSGGRSRDRSEHLVRVGLLVFAGAATAKAEG